MMKKLMMMISFLSLTCIQAVAQEGNKIIVEVENIESNEGTVNVAIYNSEKDFLGTPFMTMKKKADTGGLVFEFTGVPDGEYAISLYHDINANGELDKNFMGIPNEPYGVSREGRNMFGPPSYSGAAFTLNNENARLVIKLD